MVAYRERRWRDMLVAVARRREAHAIGALFVLLVAFFVLLLAIREEELTGFDRHMTLALQNFRAPWLDSLAQFLTFLGGGSVLVPLGAVAAGVLVVAGRKRAALLVGLSLLGHPMNLALKLLARRPRPSAEGDTVAVLMDATGTSFPSGHAMATVIFFGFLAYLVWVLVRPGRVRLGGVLSLALLTISIGISRIYVGGHWFSDVVGGWVCGLFFLLVLAEGYRLLAPGKELAPVETASAH